MDQSDLRRIACEAMALNPAPLIRYRRDSNFVVRDGVSYVRQDIPGPGFNWAGATGAPVPLDQIRRFGDTFFANCAGGWGVLVEADVGHPVEAEIRNRGWALAEEEPAFVLPSVHALEAPPAELHIRRVNDARGLLQFTETAGAAFETPRELWEKMLPPEAAAVDPDIAYFIGWHDDTPVATAMMYRVASTACIAGVAVLPAHRRRGFGTAVTAAAVEAGAACGCTAAALRSGPMSLKLYQRMGFRPAGVHKTYAAPAS